MAFGLAETGVATISDTSSVNSVNNRPYVDVTGSFTATNAVWTTVRTAAVDINGPIALSFSRVNATTGRFEATRQIPSGSELVFEWVSLNTV